MITQLDPDIRKADSLINALDPVFIVFRCIEEDVVEACCCDTYEEYVEVTRDYAAKEGYSGCYKRNSKKAPPLSN